MRALFIVGIVLIALGVILLIVPIPHRERAGIDAGPVSVGITTTEKRLVPPAVTITMIAGGVVLMIAGSRKRS